MVVSALLIVSLDPAPPSDFEVGVISPTLIVKLLSSIDPSSTTANAGLPRTEIASTNIERKKVIQIRNIGYYSQKVDAFLYTN